MTKTVWITTDEDGSYSGISVGPKPPKYSDGKGVFNDQLFFHTSNFKDIFGIDIKNGKYCKAKATIFPNGGGFKLELIGKPKKPKAVKKK